MNAPAKPPRSYWIIAVIAQFAYTFWGMDAIRLLGAAQVVPFPLVIFAIGAFLLWFSRRAAQRGYLA